jgi:hypothetical protein
MLHHWQVIDNQNSSQGPVRLTRETQATELQGQGAACLSSQLFIKRLPEESNSAPLRDIATDDPGAVD